MMNGPATRATRGRKITAFKSQPNVTKLGSQAYPRVAPIVPYRTPRAMVISPSRDPAEAGEEEGQEAGEEADPEDAARQGHQAVGRINELVHIRLRFLDVLAVHLVTGN